MATDRWNRLRAWTGGFGTARRIESSSASSHRRAMDQSACAIGGQEARGLPRPRHGEPRHHDEHDAGDDPHRHQPAPPRTGVARHHPGVGSGARRWARPGSPGSGPGASLTILPPPSPGTDRAGQGSPDHRLHDRPVAAVPSRRLSPAPRRTAARSRAGSRRHPPVPPAPVRPRRRPPRRHRPRHAYGSAGANSSVSVAGATGGSPPWVTKIRVGRSGGMLNGISISIRPSVP